MCANHGNQQVSDEELLAAFDEIEGPFVTASELEDILPITRTAIHKRLCTLEEEGEVFRKKPTQRMVGWWREEDQEFSEI
ncbi:HTH domain-containing protein [Haloarcula salinisoli]|uniref:HTH domain-containing protein n=1 Tax=Haloarcula salinisoli TaxID=2487746 RepID=A0A8J7YPU6_9EURY|nr:HTH domain-containing protein [Halomicroarcula salinisoli]MBX0305706.1 HTH domain-containing protein [Halomicroarcula salinisoli]